ncbi:MAG: type I-MYXAN CRISPR-associated protein Cas6/Cmx6 [Burkholderiales bacterium]|jgi:CRISPR-associated protein Cas6
MPEVVDVAFVLKGGTIPSDHGWSLYRLLAEQLAWLDADETAGVHPIRGARSGNGAAELYVGGRGRLMLRLQRERAQLAFALSGTRLDLGEGVEIGAPQLRTLFAHSTLYSRFVAAESDDEVEFLHSVNAQLQQAGIACKVVLGKLRRADGAGAQMPGFSVMLHELSPEHSLAMQQTGLGAGRKLGCGIFVPHRSAAAVGT